MRVMSLKAKKACNSHCVRVLSPEVTCYILSLAALIFLAGEAGRTTKVLSIGLSPRAAGLGLLSRNTYTTVTTQQPMSSRITEGLL